MHFKNSLAGINKNKTANPFILSHFLPEETLYLFEDIYQEMATTKVN